MQKLQQEVKKERNNRFRESTPVQRSSGQPRPFRKYEKPRGRGWSTGTPRGGRRATQQSFSEVQPLIFYIPFLTEMVPLSYSTRY